MFYVPYSKHTQITDRVALAASAQIEFFLPMRVGGGSRVAGVIHCTYHSGVNLGQAQYADIDIMILSIFDNANHFLINL